MSDIWRSERCLWTCWAISAVFGLFTIVQVTPGFSLLAALMFAGGLTVLIGITLTRIACFDNGIRRNLGLALGLEIDDGFKAETAAPVDTMKTQDSDAAVRPEFLASPRELGADDLRKIKGIGPKLEKLCHQLGVYHFDQIAAWSAEEVAWMDTYLEGFRGRVTRDGWVAQAKTLATEAALKDETSSMNRDKDGGQGAG